MTRRNTQVAVRWDAETRRFIASCPTERGTAGGYGETEADALRNLAGVLDEVAAGLPGVAWKPATQAEMARRAVTVTLPLEQWEEFRTALRGAASIYIERPTVWPGEPEAYIHAAQLIQELVELLPPPPLGPFTAASSDWLRHVRRSS